MHISSVYNRHHGYIEIVGRLAEHSMQKAVEEVQILPEYSTTGEVNKLLFIKVYFIMIIIWSFLTTVDHH